eukprot:CAMPEP_0113943824 /NCGR_PEP_ID=MMETSP1339-20121228/28252_1 /TAXON_ID=94617 /ORGANISM="Fibrocapsa japonica" /LENGTH=283 /DNA_ID=CAMNT_0000948787 /DNA_START=49 /DNA_END=900 /DNA_ORIENTATION=+ /assembly_acc=CAM_ASM_000762
MAALSRISSFLPCLALSWVFFASTYSEAFISNPHTTSHRRISASGSQIHRINNINHYWRVAAAQKTDDVPTQETDEATASEQPPADVAEEPKKEPKQEVSVDDLLNTPAFLQKKIEALNKSMVKVQEQIDEADAEAAKEWEEWGPQISRAKREYQALRARMVNATMEASTTAKVKCLKEVLQAYDNFQRAQAAFKPQSEDEQAALDQYTKMFDDLNEVFTKLGMKEIPTVGEPFDFNLHSAVMQQPSDEYPEDTICLEYAKGYMVDGEMIRPAMVVVSAGPGP